MEFRKVVFCAKCHQPIVSGEGFGFACFKTPGKQRYQFFHRRLPGGDCWEVYVRERR